MVLSIKYKNIKAFTLIELSIVLTIIALISGIIVGGNIMLRNAQIRSIISDSINYKNAISIFEERYGALPGDIKASNIWSGANNGNENGRIGNGLGNDMNLEPIYAWQHLSLAKLIFYDKSLNSFNFPNSKISNAFYVLYDQPNASPMYDRIGTYLGLNAKYSSSVWGSSVTNIIAQGIDNKIDDGYPSNGMIYIARGDDNDISCSSLTTCKCVNKYWNNTSGIDYIYNDNSISCRIVFWLKEMG